MAVDTIEKAIFSILSNDGDVAGLVSARIYPNVISRLGTVPAITYQQTEGERDHVMDGASGLVDARFDIVCWTTTSDESRTLANFVRIAINAFNGTVGTVRIPAVFLDVEKDELANTPDVRGLRRYSKRLTFTVWYKESIS